MSSYAIRILMSYADASNSNIITYLADRSDVAVFYEHSPETGTGYKYHIHGYVEGCTVSDKRIYSKLTELGAPRGNAGRSCKTTFGKEPDISPVDKGYITYSSKGMLEPSFVKGVEKTEIENLRLKWVDHKEKSGTQGRQSAPGEKPVKKKAKTQYDMYREIMDILLKYEYTCDCFECGYVPKGQTRIPIRWSYGDTHKNLSTQVRIIHQVRAKYGVMTPPHVLKTYLYMIENDGREFEHSYSSIYNDICYPK